LENFSNMIWYKDWQFWTVVISGTALLISVLPYLKVKFQKGKLKVEKHRTCFVTHRVGTPNINLHVTFKNVGGSPVTVKAVNLEVTRDKTERFELIGNGFLIKPNDPQYTMLTPFDLKADESWSHTINFHELWSRKKQQKYRQLESRIREHIQGTFRFNPPEPGELAVARKEDVEEISQFFDENFRWDNGEYEVRIIVLGEHSQTVASENFMFTLFESESEELQSYKNDLQYGFGVHLVPTNRIHGINIDMTQ